MISSNTANQYDLLFIRISMAGASAEPSAWMSGALGCIRIDGAYLISLFAAASAKEAMFLPAYYQSHN